MEFSKEELLTWRIGEKIVKGEPLGLFKKAIDWVAYREKKLKRVFEKYQIPDDRQRKIYYLLVHWLLDRFREIEKLEEKGRRRINERFNTKQFRRDVYYILAHGDKRFDGPPVPVSEKKVCLSVIDLAIDSHDAEIEEIKRRGAETNKRTLEKFRINPRDLRAHSILIKYLIPTH